MKKVFQKSKVNHSELIALKNEDFTLLKFKPSQHHLLNFHKVNRETMDAHIERIKALVKKNGLLRFPVVSKIGDFYYIVDGQHLIKGFLNSKKDIYCLYTEGDFIENILDINSSSRNYTYKNRIHTFAKQGDKDYVTLWKKHNDENITSILFPGLITKLYACKKGEKALLRREAGVMAKNRLYKIPSHISFYDNIVRQIADCNKAGIQKAYHYYNSLIDIMVELGDKYNHSKFIKNIKNSKTIQEGKWALTENGAYNQLREIYDGKKYNFSSK